MDKSTRILTNIILLSVFFSLIGANVAYDNSSEVTRIYGTVFDCKGNGTISGANVTAYNSNFSASNLTDADGNYVLHVPEDLNLSVVVKFPGHLESFKSIKTGKDTINMNFTLGQPAVTITAPLEAFINENFQVSLTFDNNATTPGFGPIVELILPPR
ncbi:MAG: carboxypeptidase-like regulatory domain-containing protein [Methanothermobacter sp.]|nr:carboxypeptidase-like regulatory domain-containing protein [Methanothermobacter sp.]